MVLTLLGNALNLGIKFIASPLQPWIFDTKITSQKIAVLI